MSEVIQPHLLKRSRRDIGHRSRRNSDRTLKTNTMRDRRKRSYTR